MDIKTIQDKLYEAVSSDLEHGVHWLNEQASKEFGDKYPELTKFIEFVMDLDFDE